MSQAANTFWINNSIPGARSIARRRVRSRRLVDGLVMMIVIATAATCASVYWRTKVRLDNAVARHQYAAQKVENLQLEVGKLEREVQQLRTNPQFIESFARQNLGLVRPGEVVIRLGQPEKEANEETAETKF